MKLPSGASLNQVAVGATQSVTLADSDHVPGTIFSDLGDTEVGNDAKVGNLFVNGTTTLHDRSVVTGNILTKVIAPSSSATISGTVTQKNPFPPPVSVVWTLNVNTASLGDVQLEPNQSRDLSPGTYGHFSVKSRSTVTLHSGVYELADFLLEPQARLVIDDSQGPVQVVVDGSYTFRGAIASASPALPQILFAVLGTSVEVEAPFIGAIVAPQAAVHFQAARPQGHRAFVYGSSVKLEPGTNFSSFPFDWTTVVGIDFDPIPANVITRDLSESPRDLTLNIAGDGSGKSSSSATSATPGTFSLRPEYTVGGGIIGNGSVSFRFRLGIAPWVTCTYKGQSSTTTPNTPDELIKGTHLVLQGCSDNLPATTARTADQFELSAAPAAGYPVTVKSPALEPRACDDDMELLSPDQTRQMREGFNWSTAHKVAEITPDGRPTLYYAWVFIRNKAEALALKKLYIHVLQRPLFDDELVQFAGRCGVFTNPGDGTGAFEPVVMPGKTYNKLIDALSSGDIQGDRTVFDAVIIRKDVPAAARNANGSINLDVLGHSGFRYLSYDPNAFADPSTMKLDGGAARALVGVLEWVGQAARDAGEVVTGVLNEIDQFFRGEINVTFYMQGLTRDSIFGNQPMVRGWGNYAGNRLAAEGMEVKVLQRLFDSPIPTTAQDDTNMVGVAKIDMTDGAESRGTGLCVEMRTSAALITDFLLASELCDLRGYVAPDHFAPNQAGYGNPEVAKYQFQFDSSKTNYVLNIDNTRLMGLYQSDDVYQYARKVIGFEAPRARIMSGYWADTFAPTTDSGRKRLFTPCLNFPNSFSDAMTAAASGVGALAGAGVGSIVPGLGTGIGAAVGAIGAGTFAAVIGNSDIVMSTSSSLHESRAVMSHEYGHYEYCSMAYEENSDAVDHIVWGTMLRGNELNYPLRYSNEAVADFFMGQVSGGADYNWAVGRGDSVSDTYCDPSFSGECWDQNLDGTNGASQDPGHRNIGRLATLFQDVVDGQGAARTVNAPTDADSFMFDTTAGYMTYSPTGYGSKDSALERVSIPGSGVRTILHGFAHGMAPFFKYSFDDGRFEEAGRALDVPKILSSVNQAMVENNVNWCERCRVFALHEPGIRPKPGVSLTIADTFSACRSNGELALALGEAPPDPYLRIDAESCRACPTGQTSDANGVCQPCVGEVVGNRCQKCVADVVVDGATMPADQSFDLSTSAPGDNCPDTFWLEVDHPGAVFAAGADVFNASLSPSPFSEANCDRSWTLITAFADPRTGYFSEHPQTGIGDAGHCPADAGFCLNTCNNVPVHEVTPAEAFGTVMRFGSKVMPHATLDVHTFISGPPPQ
ncbi:MAG: hypothetical protein ABJB12_03525 [Pseudomonadota bacterium]